MQDAGSSARRAPARTPSTSASVSNLFCFCVVSFALLWLPMAVLQQVDAMLRFATPLELLLDSALLLTLLSVAAAALSALAGAARFIVRKAGLSPTASDRLAWLIVMVPVGLMCIWQSALTLKLWIEQVAGARFPTGGLPHRNLLVLVLVIGFAVLWRWFGITRIVNGVVTSVLRLRAGALGALMLAVPIVAWQRPPFATGDITVPAPTNTARGQAPDIIVITLDALAAEDAGLCGDNPANMPHLRELASRATCFSRHYAVSNLTFPSTTSLETSTLPWSHWALYGGRLPADAAASSLGARLRDAGYTAHSVSAAPGASPLNHGTRRSYDSAVLAPSAALNMTLLRVIAEFPDAPCLQGLLSGLLSLASSVDLERLDTDNPYPAENVLLPAQNLLSRLGTSRPVFLWTHLWPPHAPYLAPRSTRYQLLPAGELDHYKDFLTDVGSYPPAKQPAIDKQRLRYQETIRGVDESLGRFLQELQRQGRYDPALIVVTADHGESFERGVLGHGGPALHEAMIHIPLLIKLPGQSTAQSVSIPTSQADIAQTLLDLVDLPAIPAAEGRSLAPALHGRALAPAPVFSMAIERESRFVPIRGGRYAIIDGHDKLVCALAGDRCELYDLATDPREAHDLATAQPERAGRLRSVLKDRIDQAERLRHQRFGSR